MANPSIIWLILVLPLIGGAVAYVVGNKFSGWVHVIFSGVVFILSIAAIFGLEEPIVSQFTWFRLGWEEFSIGIWYDQLSAVMTIVVTIVALMVGIFSTEYMKHDASRARYFGLLGLFAFSMYGIVLSSNFLMTFIFWELVGFSSYLLIGFWFQQSAPPISSFKAFIMNRVGDAGFLLGLFIVFAYFRTFDIQMVLSQAHHVTDLGMTPALIFLMGFGLFLAAVGKSAQFPLQTWLPDAMTGPTPVSALIHAATMVAAGVYLMVRVFPLLSADMLTVMTIAGALTAFMGAFAAFAQNDIKKILAYSTVSQLGYMIMAVGVGVPMAAFFHLVTHAFFKAGLFLCAGSIIHYFHETRHEKGFDWQDIRNMGGLKKVLPFTFWVFTICSLSLAGIPLFSGYLSKEMILLGLLADHVPKLGVVFGFAAVFMTAAYMSRLYFKVFFGPGDHRHLSETRVVKVALGVLSILSVGILFSLNPINPEASWLVEFLSVVVPVSDLEHSLIVPLLSIGLALMGILSAYYYVQEHPAMVWFDSLKTGLFGPSKNHFYLDWLYQKSIVTGIKTAADLTYRWDKKILDRAIDLLARTEVVVAHFVGWCDKHLVDGLIRLIAAMALFFGGRFRKIQGGNIQSYFIWAVIGVLTIFYFMN